MLWAESLALLASPSEAGVIATLMGCDPAELGTGNVRRTVALCAGWRGGRSPVLKRFGKSLLVSLSSPLPADDGALPIFVTVTSTTPCNVPMYGSTAVIVP